MVMAKYIPSSVLNICNLPLHLDGSWIYTKNHNTKQTSHLLEDPFNGMGIGKLSVFTLNKLFTCENTHVSYICIIFLKNVLLL